MLGAICGDIVGSRFEFHNYRKKDFTFWHENCRFTDDTVMTCAVAEAILNCQGDYTRLEEETGAAMHLFGQAFPRAGYGGRFAGWLRSDAPKPYYSFGNGSAMRVSPVAWAAKSLEEAEQLAEAVSLPTHNHPEGIKGAQAAAAAVFLARTGAGKPEIERYIARKYYPLDSTELGKKPDDIRMYNQFDETCMVSVPQAIRCFLDGESFEDVIRTAISIGGDSDTIGAIAGAIAEGFYGMDEVSTELSLSYLPPELREIVAEFREVMQGR